MKNEADGMNKHEKAIRTFTKWMLTGLELSDIELVQECMSDAEIPATAVSSEVIDAIEKILAALINLRSIDREKIKKNVKHEKIVDLDKWKNIRTA